jgi:hypothetical protein
MTQSLKKIIYFIALIFLITVFVSCVSTKPLVIEIPQQSRKELPHSIQSLTLVNRTIDNSFNDIDTDSLQKTFYLHSFNYDTIVNDIQASDTTLIALGELLFESGRYDFVIPKNRFLKFDQNSFFNTAMEWDEVRELCKTYNTDAVLSLDYFKTRFSTDYNKESYYDPGKDGFIWISMAEMKIYYEALFRVYDPVHEKIILKEFMRDTLIWEDMNRTVEELFYKFTPVKKALSETGIAIALDFSEKISTKWRKEHRSYFNKGDAKLKQAAMFVDDSDWETAMLLWKEIVENSKSKSTKSKAEFNLAVGSELQGNLDEAINWALKSYKTMYRQVTYNYLETLKRRKNEKKGKSYR